MPQSVKKRLIEYLARSEPAVITEAVWRDLLASLAPVSESYLRELLIATGRPFDQPYAGIRQHTFEELEQSLKEMFGIYSEAVESGQRERARYCRKQVIAARDRAKFLAGDGRLSEEKRAVKREMAEWMLVWLENPPIFPAWMEARKRTQSP